MTMLTSKLALRLPILLKNRLTTSSSFQLRSETDNTGHQSRSSSQNSSLSAEDEALIAKFRENQANAKKLSFAQEVRTLIDQSLCFGTLSTNSLQYEGYPTGSIVGFELDDDARPFFSFSEMSAHTKDIKHDSKSSLTILAKDFKGAAEGRVVIIGNIRDCFSIAELIQHNIL